MRKKIKLGDVIEISTIKGNAYAQYVFNDNEYGQLIRILPGIYKTYPSDIKKIVEMKELYFVFYPLSISVRQNRVKIISNEKIPSYLEKKPILRRPGNRESNGKVLNWWIIDNDREYSVKNLNDKQVKYSLAVIVSFDLLEDKILTGWMPEDEI